MHQNFYLASPSQGDNNNNKSKKKKNNENRQKLLFTWQGFPREFYCEESREKAY